MGIIREFLDFHDFLGLGIFRGALESGRHPRGILDHIGLIPAEHQLKPSNMDLFRVKFHDFEGSGGTADS